METKILIILWVLIMILVLLSTPTKCIGAKEGFLNYFGYYKNYCGNCESKDRTMCAKCLNCGVCYDNIGRGKCMPGDSNGPFFTNDCSFWEYSDPYFNYPYSHLFPVVRVKQSYPFYSYKFNTPYNHSQLKKL